MTCSHLLAVNDYDKTQAKAFTMKTTQRCQLNLTFWQNRSARTILETVHPLQTLMKIEQKMPAIVYCASAMF